MSDIHPFDIGRLKSIIYDNVLFVIDFNKLSYFFLTLMLRLAEGVKPTSLVFA